MLERIQKFLLIFFPLKSHDAEMIDRVVLRLAIALLHVKDRLSKHFRHRQMIDYNFSDYPFLKDITSIFAFWVNEEQNMGRAAKVDYF